MPERTQSTTVAAVACPRLHPLAQYSRATPMLSNTRKMKTKLSPGVITQTHGSTVAPCRCQAFWYDRFGYDAATPGFLIRHMHHRSILSSGGNVRGARPGTLRSGSRFSRGTDVLWATSFQ